MDTRNDEQLFRERYGDLGSRIARQVELDAFGHDVGLNGYTTLSQADALCRHLRVGPGRHLLDLGAGRGWPGMHLAARLGCRLVSVDVPWEALAAAKGRGADWVVSGDGRALPLRTGSCDAVVHADVLC
jgi:SAM-dependent methyltransferase